jgi:Tfp pilus assembly protein FimT
MMANHKRCAQFGAPVGPMKRELMKHAAVHSNEMGFSLTELLIVAAVMLVVGAMAAPTVINTVDAYKMRSSAMDVEGLVQRARMRAVRDNAFYFVRTQQVVANGQTVTQIYIDLNGNNVADTGERLIQLPITMSMPNAGYPALSQATLGFAPEPSGTTVAFNARGLPCIVTTTICSNWDNPNPVGFVWYLQDTRTRGTGWAAVSISPAGRVKVWTWNGNSWTY